MSVKGSRSSVNSKTFLSVCFQKFKNFTLNNVVN